MLRDGNCGRIKYPILGVIFVSIYGQEQNQEQITEISRMEFRRQEETAVQRFADVSLPRCPLCRDLPRWKIHNANVITSMFPVQEVDRFYHMKCQCCGAVLHTRYHAIGSSLPVFVLNPDPEDSRPRMVVDDLGLNPRRSLEEDTVYSVAELNQPE